MARKSYQEGSVFPSANGKNWKARYRVRVVGHDGKKRRKQASVILGPRTGPGSITKAQAKVRLTQELREINAGRHKPESTMTLRQFIEQHWAPLSRKTLASSTLAGYQVNLKNHVLTNFGDYSLNQIHPAEIQNYLNQLANSYATETISSIRTLLSGILRLAYEWGWLEANPMRMVRSTTGRPSRPRVALSITQCHRLLRVLTEPEHTMIAVALMTGLRRSELAALRRSQDGWQAAPHSHAARGPTYLDCKNRLIAVREAMVNGQFVRPKTTNSKRVVPLDTRTIRLLQDHLRRNWIPNRNNLVFTTSRGTPLHPENINKRKLRPACRRARIPVVAWHDLRHTHATLLGPILKEYLIKIQLGHLGSGVTFGVYVHDDLECRRTAIEKLGGLLFPSCSPAAETDTETAVLTAEYGMPEEDVIQ